MWPPVCSYLHSDYFLRSLVCGMPLSRNLWPCEFLIAVVQRWYHSSNTFVYQEFASTATDGKDITLWPRRDIVILLSFISSITHAIFSNFLCFFSNFVCPITGAHTNGVERTWRPLKAEVRKVGYVGLTSFDVFLHGWRYKYQLQRSGMSFDRIHDTLVQTLV